MLCWVGKEDADEAEDEEVAGGWPLFCIDGVEVDA